MYTTDSCHKTTYQEIGSDHLPIVAEFAFSLVENESEQEDESEQDDELEKEMSTAQHIYFSSDSESSLVEASDSVD